MIDILKLISFCYAVVFFFVLPSCLKYLSTHVALFLNYSKGVLLCSFPACFRELHIVDFPSYVREVQFIVLPAVYVRKIEFIDCIYSLYYRISLYTLSWHIKKQNSLHL